MPVVVVAQDQDHVARRLQGRLGDANVAQECVAGGATQTRNDTHEAAATGLQYSLHRSDVVQRELGDLIQVHKSALETATVEERAA